jgi:DNA-binding LacI/PurR family transcriptional regulator
VATLTEEILQNAGQTAFPIASEHQLCRRFNISRVTVRLALSDLENRGLIYRKHGKGTFAHGRATRVHKHLGVLIKSPNVAGHRPMTEMVRGVQTVTASLQTGTLLISTSPEQWRPEKVSTLAGVIVVPQNVTANELEILKDRNLNYILFGESDLPGPRILLGQRIAARRMVEQLLALGHRRIALLSGFEPCLDAPKRSGVHDALQDTGIDPMQIPEISAKGEEGGILQAVMEILKLRPRPTAVVAFDDSLGAVLSFEARRQEGISVPEDMSIVSFHDWPYLNYIEPSLTTVRFEFFKSGQHAAEALNLAALTGGEVSDLKFDPVYREGRSVGRAPDATATTAPVIG